MICRSKASHLLKYIFNLHGEFSSDTNCWNNVCQAGLSLRHMVHLRAGAGRGGGGVYITVTCTTTKKVQSVLTSD